MSKINFPQASVRKNRIDFFKRTAVKSISLRSERLVETLLGFESKLGIRSPTTEVR